MAGKPAWYGPRVYVVRVADFALTPDTLVTAALVVASVACLGWSGRLCLRKRWLAGALLGTAGVVLAFSAYVLATFTIRLF